MINIDDAYVLAQVTMEKVTTGQKINTARLTDLCKQLRKESPKGMVTVHLSIICAYIVLALQISDNDQTSNALNSLNDATDELAKHISNSC